MLPAAMLAAAIVLFYRINVSVLDNHLSKKAATVVDSSQKVGASNNARPLRQLASDSKNGKDAPSIGQATIAFAVSVTGCGSDPITEGAAVLGHSIHQSSIRNTKGTGRYDYALFAIYHPDARACAVPLRDLGWTLLERNVFVNVTDIEGEFLRTRISKNGCCGEKELIKLEAFRLTEYPIVVHLDLDVLVLQPLDDLFDMMLKGPESVALEKRNEILMWKDRPLPTRINAFYTYDYNMVHPGLKYKPVQGGFLVVRPNMTVYEEFREIVRKGDFQSSGGWGGAVGPFYGSMTFQGLIPYYYDYLHPNHSVELLRCIYNQMCDNPRTEKTVNDVVHGPCRTGQEDCEDCRSRPLEDVVTTHFTLCQKPWSCLPHSQDMIQHRLCRKLTNQWYKIRSELEQSWGRPEFGTSTFERDLFFGYCERPGGRGYSQIAQPYGKSILVPVFSKIQRNES